MSILRNCFIVFLTIVATVSARGGKGKGKGKKGEEEGQAARLGMEHLDALTACDVDALVALRSPSEFVLYLPAGLGTVNLVEAEAGWNDYCAGLAGTNWEILYTRDFGESVVIGWKITNPGLIEEYTGHDAFFSDGDELVGQVTTFDFAELVFVAP